MIILLSTLTFSCNFYYYPDLKFDHRKCLSWRLRHQKFHPEECQEVIFIIFDVKFESILPIETEYIISYVFFVRSIGIVPQDTVLFNDTLYVDHFSIILFLFIILSHIQIINLHILGYITYHMVT